MMGENHAAESNQSLTVSIGNSSPAVPGFPSPSSSFLPPPTIAPTEFARVDDKRRDRKNSKPRILRCQQLPPPLSLLRLLRQISLHRPRSLDAPVIELPKDLPTDDHGKSLNLAFAAAAASTPPSSIFNPKPTSSRTPSNPPTPSSPSFQFSASRKNPNRDSTMSTFSASSAASVDSASSLKSTRPAPPSPAMSRRTSGTGFIATSPLAERFSSGSGAGPTLGRSNSSSRSPQIPSMSSNPYRFSSPALRRDSSSMSIPAPLPLTPVPGSAALPPDSSSLGSAASIASSSLSSAGLRTATTASVLLTGMSKGKSIGVTSMRRPIKIRDFAYAPPEGYWMSNDFDLDLDSDPRFFGLGIDGKGLHVPTPNRVKVLNKALLTATSPTTSATIVNANNAAYAAWKVEYKQGRKDHKAAMKHRAKQLKEAKRQRERARYSMNSVRSVGSTHSTTSTSSVSSTSSRSDVSESAEGEDDDEDDDGMGGWAGFKFGLGRLSQSWGFGNISGPGGAGSSSTLNSNNTSTTANKTSSSSSAFPSRSELERNFGFESEPESYNANSAVGAPSSDSSSHSSHSTDTDTDTEGEGEDDEFHDAPESHFHLHRHLDLDLGLDSPSPLDYDRQYSYDEYGAIPNSAYPSASPYPSSNDGYGYGYGYADNNDSSLNGDSLLPGLYRALYTFEPEGPSEMRLVEGEIVKVIGRGGGGGGWAVVLDKYADGAGSGENGSTTPNATSTSTIKYALVPESYLELVQLDEPVPEAVDDALDSAEAGEEENRKDRSAEAGAQQKTPTLGL
ncbi:hypothetical protein BT96DRAFT_1015463 [Gymnopus androsaceus JB14]|uniref:SH3 domain-containing protein n=1 Tax=Gymnopus androsaceus JB14 TaxID=1447944 RepID=A0A6A4IAE8_9AGAR|nr:hypothetical protein BT96DRAFT_1015463 [Gymnopus androsaceus JB14]